MSTNTLPHVSDGYHYHANPRKQVVDLTQLLDKPAEILDIGAGFGNNCELLLQHGHKVTVTETNEEALLYLRTLGKQYPGQLTVLQEPVQQLSTTRSFDAVICTMVLHFLTEQEALQAIQTMQHITRPGGYNVITNYLVGQDTPVEYTWLLQPNALPRLYPGWNIVAYEETHPFGLRTVRSVRQLVRWLLGRRGYKAARLIARKGHDS